MASPAEKNQKLTYGDYLEWPDEERWEIIDGELFNITPTPSRRHQDVLMALASKFYNFLEDKFCEVYVAPFDVRLPEGDQSEKEINTVVQPDLTVICDPAKLDEKGCLGSPDLIIEIISPSTAAHDYAGVNTINIQTPELPGPSGSPPFSATLTYNRCGIIDYYQHPTGSLP